jgi:protein-L-isoaspartate(D-aspartate) O-methyltransferase
LHPGSIPGEASNPPHLANGRPDDNSRGVADAGAGMSMAADFEAQRIKMVDGQVRTTDVTDQPLLAAMLSVAREEFVPARRRELAYIDEDIEVAGAGGGRSARFLMEPSPFARLVQLAAIRPTDFVLDVGCATGYSSAVLSKVASFVVALESDADLAETASSTLARLGYENVAVVSGPLTQGHPGEAPYDVIVVEGAVDEVPRALLDQLKDGGRLVAVVGQGHAASAVLHVRDGDAASSRRAFNAAVMPLDEFRKIAAFEF